MRRPTRQRGVERAAVSYSREAGFAGGEGSPY